MSTYIINGGKKLTGHINVGGSKNAALAIIFATVLIRGTSTLFGVPDINDVKIAVKLISNLGATVTKDGDALVIDTSNLEYSAPDQSLAGQIRASAYLIGACLSRFGRAHLSSCGGCNFSERPIDMHILAATTLGATVENGVIVAKTLHGADLFFKKISVGATVNAILMAAGAVGETRIFGYAKEPHVISLAEFLASAGARIIVTDEYISVCGGTLFSTSAKIIPDMIEAGTYVALALATKSQIEISPIIPSELLSFFAALEKGGAELAIGDSSVRVISPPTRQIDIVAAPYPAFPTDLQPQSAPLFAINGGTLQDTVWPARFGYLSALSAFGVKHSQSGNKVKIFPSRIVPAVVTAPDLRGGAALLIAALMAEGKSVVGAAEIIDRGYENIAEKLTRVGASIEKSTF